MVRILLFSFIFILSANLSSTFAMQEKVELPSSGSTVCSKKAKLEQKTPDESLSKESLLKSPPISLICQPTPIEDEEFWNAFNKIEKKFRENESSNELSSENSSQIPQASSIEGEDDEELWNAIDKFESQCREKVFTQELSSANASQTSPLLDIENEELWNEIDEFSSQSQEKASSQELISRNVSQTAQESSTSTSISSQHSITSSSEEETDESDDDEEAIPLTRVMTFGEHTDVLKKAIQGARRSILITSYGIRAEVMEELSPFFKNAHTRGVKTYIYNSDRGALDKRVGGILRDLSIEYRETFTHAKILVVDNNLIALGSFNWLGEIEKFRNINASLVLKNMDMPRIVQSLWCHLTYYRNLQFNNEKNIRQYQKKPDNFAIPVWTLGGNTTLSYLKSLEAHRSFVQEAFETAKTRIIFCSPFINLRSGFDKDFTMAKLWKAVKRGVNITFVVKETDENFHELKKYLGNKLLAHKRFHLIEKHNFHFKTAIVDNHCIAEGSFNWFSASRDPQSFWHNHEATFVLEGDEAAPFIRNAYDYIYSQ